MGRYSHLCSFASLFQGDRSKAEAAAFARAISVMGDMYASAVGTTVLQLKEIPTRPEEFDGALALFDLRKDATKETIESEFETWQTKCGREGLVKVTFEPPGSWPPAVVRYDSHETALAVLKEFQSLSESDQKLAVCGGLDTLYNDRSYDGNDAVEDGQSASDHGRGW
jgi:hypothetical protein